jgi:GIY-YIG catalytic domain-containing protein
MCTKVNLLILTQEKQEKKARARARSVEELTSFETESAEPGNHAWAKTFRLPKPRWVPIRKGADEHIERVVSINFYSTSSFITCWRGVLLHAPNSLGGELYMSCIYIHINKTNGKVYVGQTKNTYHRWRSGYKQQPYFRKAINKYGWDGFYHTVVIDGIESQEKLNNLEKLWIILLQATDRDCGYNLVPGGHVGSFEFASMGGTAANRNPENRNRLKKYTSFETCSAGGKKGGQKCVETGQIVSLGYEQGKKNKESGHWDKVRILGFASASENGRRQGLKNVENGHLKRLDQGKKNAAKLGYMSELGKRGGKKGGVASGHLRWHVRRNIINPSCFLCRDN